MKNKLLVFALLSFLFTAFSQCRQRSVGENGESCQPLNPNGDSELALLMRQMRDTLEIVKVRIKNGESPGKLPDAFLKLHTVKPSKASMKKPQFDIFASDYLVNLNMLYHSPKDKLVDNYNLLIQRCVVCHKNSCQGPLKKIYTLQIE